MRQGICKLCGEDKLLSFEHVPPSSTYNKTTRYKIISFDDYMKSPDPVNQKFKGKIYQGGVGYYSLCQDCNSFLGANYVNSYKNWVNVGREILSYGDYFKYLYRVENIEPLKIMKHIISMFISINDNIFGRSFPELIEFVKKPELKELPEKYQLFTYLNNKGDFRHIRFQVVGNFKIRSIISCSEITFPPYGFVLTFNNTRLIDHLNNITAFKNFSINERVNVDLDMYRLPTYFKMCLDYRTKEEYDNSINN